jgi:hypothetical protein
MGGISETDIIGKAFWKGPWWSHSKELQTWLQGAIKRAAGGEFIREETTHPDPEGEIHFIDFSISPIKDNEGNVISAGYHQRHSGFFQNRSWQNGHGVAGFPIGGYPRQYFYACGY